MWLHDGARSDNTIEDEIRLLFSERITLAPVQWKILTERFLTELKVHAYLHRWCRGTMLSSETLQLLSDRGISLVLDIYSERPPATGQ